MVFCSRCVGLAIRGSGLLGVFRTVLVLCFRLPSSDPGIRFRPRRECDTLGLSEDEYDSYLSSIHEAISFIALPFVGYTIRYTLSFLSVALNDSAQALSQHTPVRPTEGRIP